MTKAEYIREGDTLTINNNTLTVVEVVGATATIVGFDVVDEFGNTGLIVRKRGEWV